MRHTRVVVVLLLACIPALAAAQTWLGTSGNNWSTAANWQGGVAPASSNATVLTFGPTASTFTPVADAAWTINRIDVSNPVYAISGQPLTFDGTAPQLNILNLGHSITNNLFLAQSLLVNATHDITLTGSVSGSGGLTKVGAGTVTLAGSGFFNGVASIGQGRLRYTGPATIISVVNNSELELAVSPGVGITDPVTGSGKVLVTAGIAFGTFNHAGTTTVGATAQLDGTVDNGAMLLLDGTMNTGGSTVGSLAGAGQLNINSGTFTAGSDGADTLFTGNVSGPGDLTKVGPGRLILSGGALNTGTIRVSGGTLRFGDAGAGPTSVIRLVNNGQVEFDVNGIAVTDPLTGSGSVVVRPGAHAAGNYFQHTGPTTVMAGGRLDTNLVNNARMTLDGEFNTGDATVGSLAGAATGQMNVNSGSLTVGGDSSGTTYAGALSGPGNMTKVGNGDLVLSGTGFVNGTITIAGGTLTYGDGTTGPTTAISIVNHGLLRVNLPSGSGIIVTDPVTGSGSLLVQSGIASAGGWNHGGTTTVEFGAQLDGNVNSAGALTLNGTMNTADSTVGALSGTTGVLNLNSPTGTFTLGSNNSSTSYGGTINGPGSLVKVGSGTLTLAGGGAYSGNTTVNGGTLVVLGTHAGAATTVNTGATIGGTGTLAGSLTVNAGGTLAPGNAGPGQITSGPLTLAGTLQQQIQGASSFDRVRVPTASINNATLALTGSYVPNPGDSFLIVQADSATPISGTFSGLPEGALVTFNGRPLRISYAGGSGNDVVLTYATFVVTPSAGANGSIAPNTPQTVAHGASASFTISPDAGYTASVGGTCGGSLAGTVYTTNAVTANCTVAATFAPTPPGVVLSATSASFGGQSMGTTSPSQSVTVTNSGNSPLTVSGISIDNAQFSQSNDCGTVAPATSCTVNIAFSPAPAAGPLNGAAAVAGTLSIATNAAGSPHTVSLSGTAQKSLVTHYYRSVLNRAPDSGGFAFWQNEAARVSGLGANVNETWFAMATAFYSSPEYTALGRNTTQFVTDLYRTFFNRAPDSGGLSYWTGQMASGMPREVVLVSFMFSPEFANFTRAIFGNTAARAEVDVVMDFYRGMLSRLPDDGGFNYWVQQFRNAQCVSAAAVTSEAERISSAFALSPEYAARGRTVTQYVGDLYDAFLRRGGDLTGVQYWIDEITSGRRTREQVRMEFRNSAEFQARVSAMITQGCP